MVKLFQSVLLLLCAGHAFCQTLSVQGRVTDANGDAVPFATVNVYPVQKTFLANEMGFFDVMLPPMQYQFTVKHVNFKSLERKVDISENFFMDAVLERDTLAAANRELTADDIVLNVISRREELLRGRENYACQVYTKGVQKLLGAPRRFLGEQVATILKVDSNRRGILYQSETVSDLYYTSQKEKKEIMLSSKVAGDRQGFSFNRAVDMDISFYDNLLHWDALGSQWFISPLADNGPRYYTYELAGSRVDRGRLIHKIRVLPRRKFDPVFSGFIYILDGDWRLYHADLSLTESARINFVDTLRIRQQFAEIESGIWKPESITIETKGKVLGFDFAGSFAAVYNDYRKHEGVPQKLFRNETLRINGDANRRSNVYWAHNRSMALTHEEWIHYQVKDSLETKAEAKRLVDSVQQLSNKFRPLRFAVAGYKWDNYHNKYSFYVSSLKNTAFYNNTEGWGVKLKTGFHKQFSLRRELEVNHNFRYGFGNKVLNSNLEMVFRYDTLRHASIVFRIGTDFLDLNSRGTLNLFYNTITTLFGGRNYMQFYRSRFTSLYTQREIADGLILSAGAEVARRSPVFNTAYAPLFLSAGRMFSSRALREVDRSLFPVNNAFTVETTASYTFGQRYSLRPDGKIYETARYPTVKVRYRKGIHSVFRSAVNYDFLSADIFQDKIRLGLSGFSSFYISAGRFLNTNSLYYPDIHHFTGNQTAFYNPIFPNFHFLDYYAYATNEKFLEAHYEHNFAGLLTRKIPLLRRLKLEEIIGGAYLGQPQATYREIYFGLQRLVFRVDYGFYWPTGQKMQHTFRLFYGF